MRTEPVHFANIISSRWNKIEDVLTFKKVQFLGMTYIDKYSTYNITNGLTDSERACQLRVLKG